jgi:hypothetical protein
MVSGSFSTWAKYHGAQAPADVIRRTLPAGEWLPRLRAVELAGGGLDGEAIIGGAVWYGLVEQRGSSVRRLTDAELEIVEAWWDRPPPGLVPLTDADGVTRMIPGELVEYFSSLVVAELRRRQLNQPVTWPKVEPPKVKRRWTAAQRNARSSAGDFSGPSADPLGTRDPSSGQEVGAGLDRPCAASGPKPTLECHMTAGRTGA